MDDARIELTCPGCEEQFLVHASQQGKIVNCPSCDGWVDVPDLRDESVTDPFADEQARQWEEGAKQQAENARQIEQSQRALDHRDHQDARFDELLGRMASVIDRWDSLATKMEHVIGRLSPDGPS
jgi:Zn-finger nucleic acid-binding protein